MTALMMPVVDYPVALPENLAERLAEGVLPNLPAPPLRAFDRILSFDPTGGEFRRGSMTAAMDVENLAWAFVCHFPGDPVYPGTLMVDGLLQLTGVFGAACGFRGKGRAVRTGNAKFLSEVVPEKRELVYEISVRKVVASARIVVADGIVRVDGAEAIRSQDLWITFL